MAETYADQQFLDIVVKALVDHPEDVKSERTVDEMGVLLTLHINSADMGQIIGRSGRTAQALRTLLRIVGAKHSARVNLKIYEPEGSRRARGVYAGSQASYSTSQADSDTGVDDLNL